jgi:predicted nucleic acid-binding Zn ribbon protein
MPVVAILLGLGLLIATLPLVVSPLRRSPHGLIPAAAPAAHDASPTHTQVLLALRELEFDHQTGKVAPEDYASLRADLVEQAASAIQGEDEAEERLSERIEEAVQLRRASRTDGDRCRMCGKRLEPGDRFCPVCGRAAQNACPQCGTKAVAGDRFCSRCGEPLTFRASGAPTNAPTDPIATPISQSPT